MNYATLFETIKGIRRKRLPRHYMDGLRWYGDRDAYVY
jgi:hypothetical protein